VEYTVPRFLILKPPHIYGLSSSGLGMSPYQVITA